MLVLEIVLHYALAELQVLLLIIIIFMGKGTCNSLVFVIRLQALVCQIGNQCQLSTVGVHGWCVCACVPFSVCVHGVGVKGPILGPMCCFSLQPPPNVSRIIN